MKISGFFAVCVRCVVVMSALLIQSACTDGNQKTNPAQTTIEGVGVNSPTRSAKLGSISVLKLIPAFPGVALVKPVGAIQRRGDPKTWYVLEKKGRILQIQNINATWRSSVYLDITDRVEAGSTEGGLLGAAFHPKVAENSFLYVSYTGRGDGGDVALISTLSRFTQAQTAAGVFVGQPTTEKVLLTVNQPYGNHNGGQIAFSQAGLLYFGLGDGGAGGDPHGNGQNTTTLLGSMLRIDVDHGEKYSIPADNPFADGKHGRAEIFAWGLRNPWRWSFDRQSGELWLADVGQNAWEEVNILELGHNYGWNVREGKHCFNAMQCNEIASNGVKFSEPVLEYGHTGGNCSITGGYVYRGKQVKNLAGVYLFADFCSGVVWGAYRDGQGNVSSTQLLQTGLNISSFAEDLTGEIYVVDYGGTVQKIVSAQ